MTTDNIESGKSDKSQQRPWVVIIYVSLLVVAALYYGLQSILMTIFSFQHLMSGDPLFNLGQFFIGVGISWVVTIVPAVLAWGIWRRKNWARLVAIVAQCLVMLYILGQLFFYVLQYGIDLLPILLLVGLGILGYITHWLVKNKQYFG